MEVALSFSLNLFTNDNDMYIAIKKHIVWKTIFRRPNKTFGSWINFLGEWISMIMKISPTTAEIQ